MGLTASLVSDTVTQSTTPHRRPDLLISGGLVVDGTGRLPFRADLAVTNGVITALLDPPNDPADARGAHAAYLVDVTGLVVAPGFIDIHSHADFTLHGSPAAETVLSQGVTTLVGGNCGWSPFPHTDAGLLQRASSFMHPEVDWTAHDAGSFGRVLAADPPGVNVVLQVGHASLRLAVMGTTNRAPDATELAQLCALVEQAADEGVRGYTTGLTYAPCSYAALPEITAVAKVAAARGLTHATHMRDEGAGLLGAVDEALAIARRSGVRLQISHIKALGTANFGLVEQALTLLDDAVDEGIDVACDAYPYAASSTTLTSRLPGWSMTAGVDGLVQILHDRHRRAALAQDLNDRLGKAFEPDHLVVAAVSPDGDPTTVGMTLARIGEQRGQDSVEATLGVLAENRGDVTIVAHVMRDEDVWTVLRHPLASVASDGWVVRPHGEGSPHPRSFGTFPRVLREGTSNGSLTLTEAVRKMTSMPAARYGLTGRGLLQPGAVADIVAFDPGTITDRSTFADPWQVSHGIRHVWLRGNPALTDGAVTTSRYGQVLTDL